MNEKGPGEISYKIATPTPDEFNVMRKSAGWAVIPSVTAQLTLDNSVFSVTAVAGGRIIGMARIIGRGESAFFIADLIVMPEFRHRGIGTRLMTHTMGYFEENHRDQMIGLLSTKDREAFYGKFGFEREPGETSGSGLSVLWKTPDPGIR